MAGDLVSVLCWGTKIPYATEQLSLRVPQLLGAQVPQLVCAATEDSFVAQLRLNTAK